MGNYLSCSLSSPVAGLQSGPKVILPSGAIHHLSAASATAAELMLEHPGFFLVHSSAILINRRLFALSADEELELGVVYVMFPMDRVGSAASAADMGRLLLAAGRQARRDRAQVTPAAESSSPALSMETASENPLKPEEEDDVLIAEFRYKRSLCRSRRPALETITEEAVF
ncbi:uncharacterized protein LOC110100483 [Dendrobium catenatum]|uniref:Uncharacterized protein n=1 Tax=Dendrobium catenatum TaxID=906689 RepID=A0A2I0X416_9ASPA|nr:uncharacterized protein LOC110100483 [Dendrobium catenatum]PKU82659.1 hypothetical protein MA16_Dca018817 [Dendrobium catenatum]